MRMEQGRRIRIHESKQTEIGDLRSLSLYQDLTLICNAAEIKL